MERIGIFSNAPVSGLSFVLGEQEPHHRNPDYWNPAQVEAFDRVLVDGNSENAGVIAAHYREIGVEVEFVDAAEPSGSSGEPDGFGLSAMSVKQLRDFAQERGIDVPQSLRTKATIVEHIRAVLAERQAEEQEEQKDETQT